MNTYLERYLAGEYADTWQALTALGADVRAEPIMADARAVAQETMRRARHNVERLTERLHQIGYRFQDVPFVPTTAAQRAELDALERQIGAVPLSLRAWIEQVGTVNWMGSHPGLSTYASGTRFAVGGASTQTLDLGDLLQQLTQSNAVPSEVTNLFGKLFKQVAPQETPPEQPINDDPIPDLESDPLVVDFYEVSPEGYAEWQDYAEAGEPFVVTLAPDIFHKANISGGDGYAMHLPNPAADAPLLNTEFGDLTFVAYLRLSFEWAGFPALRDLPKRDDALLAWLKQDLLPL